MSPCGPARTECSPFKQLLFTSAKSASSSKDSVLCHALGHVSCSILGLFTRYVHNHGRGVRSRRWSCTDCRRRAAGCARAFPPTHPRAPGEPAPLHYFYYFWDWECPLQHCGEPILSTKPDRVLCPGASNLRQLASRNKARKHEETNCFWFRSG